MSDTLYYVATVKEIQSPTSYQPYRQASSVMAISNSLKEAIISTKPVQGLTHNFYRYPARFSPEFARQAILAFTKPFDCVIDPFVGGGTTLVESLALGRHAIGIDVNSLAYFTSLVKTTPLSSNDIESVLQWAQRVEEIEPVGAIDDSARQPEWLVNMPPDIAKFLVEASRLTADLRFPRQRRFARCALIRSGQLTLDCQSRIPSIDEVKTTFGRLLRNMIAGLNEFVTVAQSNDIPKNKITSMRQIFLGSTAGSVIDKIQSLTTAKPTLVLTSPPYPGIHVLYNKWQILGRRETITHYRLAELKDGHGESFYTMGGRKQRGSDIYFETLFQALVNLRKLVSPSAIVVQLVAFPDEEFLRSRYLSTMNQAGFDPLDSSNSGISDCITRMVPNRRWYAYYHEKQGSSRETLMIHRVRN